MAIESLFSEYLLNICNVPGIWDLIIKGGTRVSVSMADTFEKGTQVLDNSFKKTSSDRGSIEYEVGENIVYLYVTRV